MIDSIRTKLRNGDTFRHGTWTKGEHWKENHIYRSGDFELRFDKFSEEPHYKGSTLRDPSKTRHGASITLKYVGKIEGADLFSAPAVSIKDFVAIGESKNADEKFNRNIEKFEIFANKAFGIEKANWKY